MDSCNRNGYEHCNDFPYCGGFHELSRDCFPGYRQSVERPTTEICYFRNDILHFVELHWRYLFSSGRGLLLAYLIGGLTHGVLAQQPSLDWSSSVISSVQPYFIITKYAFVILGFSQLVFVINVWKVIFPNPLACCFASDSERKGKTA